MAANDSSVSKSASDTDSASINPVSSSPSVTNAKSTQPHRFLYTDFTDDNPLAEIRPAPIQQMKQGEQASSSDVGEAAKNNFLERTIHPINFDKNRPYFCHVCQLDSSDMEAFMKHSICVYHIRNTAEKFHFKVRVEKEKEEKKEKPSFHCQSCQITCNSQESWNAHLIGQKHRKILEKQGADRAMQKIIDRQPTPLMGFNQRGGIARGAPNINVGLAGSVRGGRGLSRGGSGPIPGGAHLSQLHGRKPYEKPVHTVRQPSSSGPIGAKDFAQYPEPLIGLEYVTEIQVIGQSPRYHCELCDSKFDHNLKFPHLVGAKHRLNVLKEKNPQVASELRNGTKKRSELTGRLLEEAQKLENQFGRARVKTRVEKSPFNAVNEAVAQGRGTVLARPDGGYTAPRGAARGAGFAGRGAAFGSTSRGASWGRANAARAVARGGGIPGRGAARGANSYAKHFVSARGRGRAGSAGRGATSWQQQQQQQQQFHQQQFQQPQLQQFQHQQQFQQQHQQQALEDPAGYQSGYVQQQQSYNQSLPGPTPPAYQAAAPPQNAPAYHTPAHAVPQQSTQATTNRAAYNAEAERAQAAPSAGSEQTASSLLHGLGDLGKLVSSEEDASVALQVSNALTHALLTFRMKQMPEGEGGAAGSGS